MSLLEMAGLVTAAFAAGIVNAVAGGGTVITFPVLLFFGTAPTIANATSTLALVLGTSGSIFGFRAHLPGLRSWLVRFVPVSVLGGWLGGHLLTVSSDSFFERLVPFLLLGATVLFLLQEWVARTASGPSDNAVGGPIKTGLAIVFQFFVALYGGYFGAGIGILMLAALGFLGLRDINQMNALKNVLGSLINVVAAICFLVGGLVDLPRAGVMTIGAVAGYFVGAHYSQRFPPRFIRRFITGVGLSISVLLFARQFFGGP